MSRIEKLSKKLKLKEDFIKDIIVYNHELNSLIPKKQLKKMELHLTLESRKLVSKVAKTLKVTEDAVIGFILNKYIEEHK